MFSYSVRLNSGTATASVRTGALTTTVTASRWIPSKGPGRPSEVVRGTSVVLLLAGLATAAGFGAAWLSHVPRRRRNRRLAELHLGALPMGYAANAPR